MQRRVIILAILALVLIVVGVVVGTTIRHKNTRKKRASVSKSTVVPAPVPVTASTLTPAPIMPATVETPMNDAAFAMLLEDRKTFRDIVATNSGTYSKADRAAAVQRLVAAYTRLMKETPMSGAQKQQLSLDTSHALAFVNQFAGYQTELQDQPLMTDDEAARFKRAWLVWRDGGTPEQERAAAKTMAPLLSKQISVWEWSQEPSVQISPPMIGDAQKQDIIKTAST